MDDFAAADGHSGWTSKHTRHALRKQALERGHHGPDESAQRRCCSNAKGVRIGVHYAGAVFVSGNDFDVASFARGRKGLPVPPSVETCSADENATESRQLRCKVDIGAAGASRQLGLARDDGSQSPQRTLGQQGRRLRKRVVHCQTKGATDAQQPAV